MLHEEILNSSSVHDAHTASDKDVDHVDAHTASDKDVAHVNAPTSVFDQVVDAPFERFVLPRSFVDAQFAESSQVRQLEDELMSDDSSLSEPRCIVLSPYTPPIIPRPPSPILVLGCEEAPIIPDWIIQRQVPNVPRYLVESKKLGLRDPFCLTRDPFTFRRYPGFSISSIVLNGISLQF